MRLFVQQDAARAEPGSGLTGAGRSFWQDGEVFGQGKLKKGGGCKDSSFLLAVFGI